MRLCRWLSPLSLCYHSDKLLPGSSRASRGVSVNAWLEESSAAERAPRLTFTWWWSCCGWQLFYDWPRLFRCLISNTEVLLLLLHNVMWLPGSGFFSSAFVWLQRFFWLETFLLFALCVSKCELRKRWRLNIAALRLVPHPLRPSNIRVCLSWRNWTQWLCHVWNTVSPL